MYEKLKRLITDKNALYKELNDEVHQLEQSVNEEAEALNIAERILHPNEVWVE